MCFSVCETDRNGGHRPASAPLLLLCTRYGSDKMRLQLLIEVSGGGESTSAGVEEVVREQALEVGSCTR